MLVTATKYSPARPAPAPAFTSTPPTAALAVSFPVRELSSIHATGVPERRAPAIIVKPKLKNLINWPEWMWQELREGGFLDTYLKKEKWEGKQRQRAVARRMQGFKQNFKSDLELKACIPAREFFRWKAEDPDFFRDDKNLRSLKRDNPDMPIYV